MKKEHQKEEALTLFERAIAYSIGTMLIIAGRRVRKMKTKEQIEKFMERMEALVEKLPELDDNASDEEQKEFGQAIIDIVEKEKTEQTLTK